MILICVKEQVKTFHLKENLIKKSIYFSATQLKILLISLYFFRFYSSTIDLKQKHARAHITK